jgi:hypothetical protein
LASKCDGDAICLSYLNAAKLTIPIASLNSVDGPSEQMLHELSIALDVAKGHWGSLALTGLNDFGWLPLPRIVQLANSMTFAPAKDLLGKAAQALRSGKSGEAAVLIERAKTLEGVYQLNTNIGQYIGQSNNIVKRIIQHFSSNGKLSTQTLEKEVHYAMPGSTKLEREVYEQYLIETKGLDNLINKVNPMGGRRDLYESMKDIVINKFNLPR